MNVMRKLACSGVVLGLLAISGLARAEVGLSAQQELERGLTYFEHGAFRDASLHLQRSVALDPRNADAQCYLGRSLKQLGEWTEAITRMKRAYELMPEHQKRAFFRELWDSIAQAFLALFDSSDIEGARVVMGDALSLAPASDAARKELLVLLINHGAKVLSAGKLDEALSALSESAEQERSAPLLAI